MANPKDQERASASTSRTGGGDALEVLAGADWPLDADPESRHRVRKRYYVVFFFLLTTLLSIGLVQVYHRGETGFVALERMYPPQQRMFIADDLPPAPDRETADRLGVTLEELYTAERVFERIVRMQEDRMLGPLDWGLSVHIGEYRILFSYRIFLNMAISAIISWALYIRARDRAASSVIDAQNRQLRDLNEVLEYKVNESQRLLRELQTTQSKLVQAQKLASIGRMSATLAHEIRNPMSIIMSAAGIAAEDVPPGSPPAEAIMLIRQEIARLDRIITELLNFAAPKRPQLDNHDLNELVASWIPPLREDLEKRGVRIELAVADQPCRVEADADQLYQVFLNVLWNARDAVQENDGGCVVIRTEPGEEHVALIFRDDGAGMDRETLQQIYEPFFTRKISGSGLGLPVVQQLMEGMGGSVTIESELERGTTVRLHLPPAQA